MLTPLDDLRFALRGLLRARYVSLVSALSIGLGVGAAVAAYSWMDGLVLHPFPATADQGRLVGIEVGPPNGGMGAWSYQSFNELQDGLRSLSGLAAFRVVRASAREAGEQGSTSLLVTTASGKYFEVLGVTPVIGRTLNDDDVRSRNPVAVLSYDFWSQRYSRRPDAIGRSIFLNGEPFTIIGVAPPAFAGVYTGVVPSFYVPLTTEPLISGVNLLDDRKLRSMLVFGRLAPGSTIEVAQLEADALARRLSASHADRPPTGADVMFLRVQFLGGTLSPLFTAMLAVTGLLVLLACANVAGLLLVRGDSRAAEIGVRLALGASRWRLVRIVLAESALLAAAGSAAALAVAYLARGAIYAFVPRGVFPVVLSVPLSGRVLAVALLGAVAVTVVSGLAPALAGLRVAPQQALRAGARSLTAGSRLRSAIAGGQLAFSLLLLVLAGMFARGLQRAAAVDVGFRDPEHVLLVDTNLRLAGATDSTGPLLLEQILGKLRGLPGVQSVATASMVPLGFGGRRIVETRVEGYAPGPDENLTAERAHVGGSYAATMSLRVVRGRDLRDDDRVGSIPVAVVNEAFATRFFGARDPVGRRIDVGRGWATIVGELHDGKYDRLDEPLHPVVYVPEAQFFLPTMTLHLRTRGDPFQLAEPVRRALLAVHLDLPATQPRTLAQHAAAATFTPRTGVLVLGVLAALSLFLSVVGLYGVLAYAVTLRARELAIRLALGAGGRRVKWEVGRRSLGVALGGSLAGAALALGGAPLLRSRIASVGPADPVVFALAALALVCAALLAAWVPARRATRLDPAAVLRSE